MILENLPYSAKDAVPLQVPVHVVVRLEAVHIQENQGKDPPVPEGPGHFHGQCLLEMTMVVQAGKSVIGGLFPEDLVQHFQFLVFLLQRLDQLLVFPGQAYLLGRAGYRGRDQVEFLKGLDQIVVGPGPESHDGGFQGSVTGHDDHLGFRVDPLDLLQEIHSAHPPHPDIRNDERVRVFLKNFQRFFPAIRNGYLISVFSQNLEENSPDGVLVVRYQNADAVLHGWRSSR